MDAYSEEYDRYEPELRVWPFILLGFLVPAVPFVCNILFSKAGINEGFGFLYGAIEYVFIMVSFFVVSYALKTSKGSWVLVLEGALFFLVKLSFWTYYKIKGVGTYPLGVPFCIAIIPSFVFLLAYAFYAKRSRLPAWGTSISLSLVYSLASSIYLYFENGLDSVVSIAYFILSLLLVLLSFLTFFVTKRSEVTPWYINIPLVLFVFSSLSTSPDFGTFSSSDLNVGVIAIYILKTVATNYMLWFFISMCFIYAGLAMKSCFKTLNKIEPIRNTVDDVNQKSSNYAANEKDDEKYDSFSVYPDGRYAYPQWDQNRFSKDRDGKYPRERIYNEPVRQRQYSDDDRFYNRNGYPQRDDYEAHYRKERYDMDSMTSRDINARPNYARDSYYDDRCYYQEDDGYRDYYDAGPSRDISRQRLNSDREQRRSSFNDEYRSHHRRGEEDKWYDLLRGGIDDSEYSHRRERDDYPPRH